MHQQAFCYNGEVCLELVEPPDRSLWRVLYLQTVINASISANYFIKADNVKVEIKV